MDKINKNILLETSKDKLSGYITILKIDEDTELDLDVRQLLNEIKKHFIYGLDDYLLVKTLTEKTTNNKICIAEGSPPIKGRDGIIKYYFSKDRPLLPKLNADGTVDYRELDSINTVKIGQVLAEIIPPTDGTLGKTVLGEDIPFEKGKMPKVKYSKNVNVSEDGLTFTSNINGLVENKNGNINVLEILKLKNIDNTVGNINFDGNVIINGDILNGFSLHSGGSVEVKGAVEGGYIESESDILVRQGIQGYNRLTVKSKGNLASKFIENSHINVDGNITSEAIMHSYVSSNSNILVLGKKGLIVGGVIKAKHEIRARFIGSTMATKTILEISRDPGLKTQFDKLSLELEQSKENYSRISQSLSILERLKKVDKLDEKKLELYNNLLKAELQINSEIAELTEELEVIRKDLDRSSRGQIKVADTIYPGVKVVIGNSYMFIRDEMKNCTFYLDGGEIRVGSY